jgi:hypothetical protein
MKKVNDSTIDKVLLYFISLSLLFLLIVVITIDIPFTLSKDAVFIGFKKLLAKNIIAIFALIMFIFSLACLNLFTDSLKGSKKNAVIISEVENLNYEPLAFLVTYILPLICLDFDNFRYIIVLIMLLVIIGTIYVKTNMFYANPTLAIMGFHTYKVKAEFGNTTDSNQNVVISKSKIRSGDRVYWRKIDDNVYYVKVVKNG